MDETDQLKARIHSLEQQIAQLMESTKNNLPVVTWQSNPPIVHAENYKSQYNG